MYHEGATLQNERSDLFRSIYLCGRLPAGVFSFYQPLYLTLTLWLHLSHVLLDHVHAKASLLNLYINFPPFPLHMDLLAFLFLHGLWRRQGFIYIVKATTVRDNLHTCKGLIRIDLQMKWDQRWLDEDLFIKGVRPLHNRHSNPRWRQTQAWSQRSSSFSISRRTWKVAINSQKYKKEANVLNHFGPSGVSGQKNEMMLYVKVIKRKNRVLKNRLDHRSEMFSTWI